MMTEKTKNEMQAELDKMIVEVVWGAAFYKLTKVLKGYYKRDARGQYSDEYHYLDGQADGIAYVIALELAARLGSVSLVNRAFDFVIDVASDAIKED